MKYLVLLGILSIGLNQPLHSQDTLYLNANWQVVTNYNLAKYKRVLQKEGNGWYVEDYYYPANTLQMKGHLSSLSPDVLEGSVVFYYKNGNIEKQGSYVKDRRMGVHKEYYESGQIQSEIDYRSEGLHFIQMWNEKGEPQLSNGTGSYQNVTSNGDIQFAFIEDYKMVKNYTVRQQQQDTVYSMVEVLPEYRGGMEKFYRIIQKQLKYPKSARRKDIEGVVYVQFTVDRQGQVTEVKTLKGIGNGCDQESERVVQQSKRWSPGLVNNNPVKCRMVLPITFKLR
ncbi:energy transducer TonB [Tunicatimonas pelagia]|uniref:energy transducer TonB n=1 Tax=Tunicatimonas pelagia TaxID=931531 RepID=UPI002665CAE5|nr:energy transducer TonB [Tunicatimonas pelagia]WKN41747.1 TonB family protein [Tunicatimonas pelagia]